MLDADAATRHNAPTMSQAKSTARSPQTRFAGVTALILMGCSGCPVTQNTDLPNPIHLYEEPDTGTEYYLYLPSALDEGDAPLPLVMSCHGTRPWDTAKSQIEEWAALAEAKNFIAVAPELEGTRGDFVPSPEKQIELQHADEKRILAVLQHVRAANSVMDDRVFLTGWSAGSYAVLHTGLRHPDVFRALAVRQGNFDPAFFGQTIPFLDHYQPIYVVHGSTDFLVATQVGGMIDWLKENRMYVFEEKTTGFHRRQPDMAFRFFRNVIKRHPWLQVNAYDADRNNPMVVLFKVKTTPPPAAYLWQFGDGEVSRDPAPRHVYAKPGEYDVQLTIRDQKEKQRVRRMRIKVPRTRVGVAEDPLAAPIPSPPPASQPATAPG
jgi:poly(3-hydroxybutyrate) depolymerase